MACCRLQGTLQTPGHVADCRACCRPQSMLQTSGHLADPRALCRPQGTCRLQGPLHSWPCCSAELTHTSGQQQMCYVGCRTHWYVVSSCAVCLQHSGSLSVIQHQNSAGAHLRDAYRRVFCRVHLRVAYRRAVSARAHLRDAYRGAVSAGAHLREPKKGCFCRGTPETCLHEGIPDSKQLCLNSKRPVLSTYVSNDPLS